MVVAVPQAFAAEGDEADKPDILVMIGIGPRVAPSYPGSTRAKAGAFPEINVWRENELLPVETPDEGKSITLIGNRGTSAAGFSIAVAPRRGEEPATAGLGTVGFGIEAGIFAETYVLPPLRLRGEVRHGIGSHAALTGEVALDLVLRDKDNDRRLVTFGPRARFAGTKYNRRFFGIDAAQSAASGLDQYAPDGGLIALGLMGGAHFPLDRQWGLFGFAGYERLQGSAADSPLTRERGSPDQFTAGLALTYIIRIDR